MTLGAADVTSRKFSPEQRSNQPTVVFVQGTEEQISNRE